MKPQVSRATPLPYRHVLFWGGLRGTISLALVFSLQQDFHQRDPLAVMAPGVVLLALLVEGTNMQLLLNRLGLVGHTIMQLEYERRQAKV